MKSAVDIPNLDSTLYIHDSLFLRQLRMDGDVDDLFALTDANREHIGKWLPWVENVNSPEDSKKFIASLLQDRKGGTTLGYGIFVNDELVGHISLMHLSDDKDPEIGYWISSGASGKGITTAAANKLTDFGFSVLRLPKIVIKARPENIASNKVAEKLGYILDGMAESENTGEVVNVWSKRNSIAKS